jgi:hypothetical protein
MHNSDTLEGPMMAGRNGWNVKSAAKRSRRVLAAGAAVLAFAVAGCDVVDKPVDIVEQQMGGPFQDQFAVAQCALSPSGRNPYFILEPGYQLVLRGKNRTKLEITVLDETREVAGVQTRVVIEREYENGKLYEVSRNFYAICPETKDVYYFGEDVYYYDGSKILGTKGSWLAGRDGARPGLIMPGMAKVGMRYYQEIAPNVAMDRAEIVSVNGSITTPAGAFPGVMDTREGTAFSVWDVEHKVSAPGIGLVRSGEMRLANYGFVDLTQAPPSNR